GRVAEDRPDGVVARPSEGAIELAITEAELVEEWLLDRVERQDDPAHAFGDGARDRAFSGRRDAVDENCALHEIRQAFRGRRDRRRVRAAPAAGSTHDARSAR